MLSNSFFFRLAFVLAILTLPVYSLSKQDIEFLNYIGKFKYKHANLYESNYSADIASRVAVIPDFLLKVFKQADNAQYYKSYHFSEADKKLLKEYLALLPPLNQKLLKERLIGIYAIEGFKGSAIADYVINSDTSFSYFIILNSKLFKTNLSDWLTYRENSTFIQDDSLFSIKVDCGNKYKALLYALLHESSHLVDYQYHITPFVEEDFIKTSKFRANEDSTEFTKVVWNSYYSMKSTYDFSGRDRITAFGFGNGPKINISEGMNIYERMSIVPVASLYGCRNWADDYADFVMAYHLTKKLGQPYRIQYSRNGNSMISIEPMQSKMAIQRSKSIEMLYEDKD